MHITNSHRLYFIGIGGIGMSSLAKYYFTKGVDVCGYDKTPSDITRELEKSGININYSDSVASIPEEYKSVEKTIVVYTPAIPKENMIYNYFIAKEYTLYKRSAILGEISKETTCLAVAGTHGKTSTSALLAHIMKEAATGASAFIGGIISNYSSNLIIGEESISIVEADEFDRSFMTLEPNISCITSTDADHLDIYGDETTMKQTFNDFADLSKKNGVLITKLGLGIDSISYSIDGDSDYVASDVRIVDNKYEFDLRSPKSGKHFSVKVNQPGKYNIENTLAAFAMAEEFGLDANLIIQSIASFRGVLRRFNVFSFGSKVIVDDYAHHPSEINAVQNTADELYAGMKVGVIFQPHLFTRTRDFEDDFAKVLSKFASVALLEIYPAREEEIVGVTSGNLLSKISNSNKTLLAKEDIKQYIEDSDNDVIMMLGAGDIGVEIKKLRYSHG